MSTSTIELPSNFVDNLLGQVNQLFTNFQGLIILIVSVLVISIVIEIIIHALRPK